MLEKISELLSRFWTWLNQQVTGLIAQLDVLPFEELLKGLILLTALLLILLALSAITAKVMTASAQFLDRSVLVLRKLFRYSGLSAVILIFLFWLFASQRPCFIKWDSIWSTCVSKTPVEESCTPEKKLLAKPVTPAKAVNKTPTAQKPAPKSVQKTKTVKCK